MKCENCSHAEMCKWIDELEGRGCDFCDEKPCELLILKSDILLYQDDKKKWAESIKQEKKNGVIILPPYFTPLLVPNDVEIRIEQEPCEWGRMTFDATSGTSVFEFSDGTIKQVKQAELEQCKDAISREDAIKALQKVACYSAAVRARMIGAIEELPPVTQKSGKWIPISERLPDEYGEYLVTWKTNDSSTPFISVCEYETSYEYDDEKHRFKGEWLVDDYILVHSDYEVVAWMPLPKPYEPQESEEQE